MQIVNLKYPVPVTMKKTSAQAPISFKYIDSDQAMFSFADENSDIEWLAMDTEFVSEKRYDALLCLIQITTPIGNYIVDPFKCKDLDPLFEMIEDERVIKITHAGENDFRLLFSQFNVVPVNVFDTQVAAGFVGYPYPTSFGKLVSGECGIELNKSYGAADWEKRPLTRDYLTYALNDVIYLHELFTKFSEKLQNLGRFDWAIEEMSRMEDENFYIRDPHREALQSSLMNGISFEKQVFTMRLFDWRRTEAQRVNHSKEMVLAIKHFQPIIRGIEHGQQTLLDNRFLPAYIVHTHIRTWQRLWETPATDEEITRLSNRPKSSSEDPLMQLSRDLVHSMVKYRCLETGVAHSLVLSKSDLFSGDDSDSDDSLTTGWRAELLGHELAKWMSEHRPLRLDFRDGQCIISPQ